VEAGEYSFEDGLKLEIDFIDLTQAKRGNKLKDAKIQIVNREHL